MNALRKFLSAHRQTRLFITAILLLSIWILWPNDNNRKELHPPRLTATALQRCLELRPQFGPYQEAVIWEPGAFCVSTDFWQQRLSDGAGHNGPAPYRHLIAIKSGDVTLNLMRHILHSDGHSSGIVVTVEAKKKTEKSDLEYVRSSRNITIKNGVIDLRGLGTAVANPDNWGIYHIDRQISNELTMHEQSSLVLENLLIKTDNVGIAIKGNDNIIRNCVIESGGNAAIIMEGTNGQILNNTIVLTNPFIPGSMRGVTLENIQNSDVVQFFKERRKLKAVIALHQATGTVINGNRIEVKGKSATRHNIYIANGSKHVRIEGNTFIGVDDPVTLADSSTAELKNNVFEKKKAPWWKF